MSAPVPTQDLDRWIEDFSAAKGEAELERELAKAPKALSKEGLARLAAAVPEVARRDLDRAGRLVRAVTLLAERLGDPEGFARALRASANLHYLRGAHEDAAREYRQAAERFAREGDELEEAVTLSAALHTLAYLGLYDRGYADAARARRTFEKLGDELRLARLQSNEANLLYRQDRMTEALALYESSLEQFRRGGGSPQDVAAALYNIATCRITLSDFDDALATYRELQEHCSRHDLPLVAARAEYNVAYLHYLRGEYMRAIELYQQARELCERQGDPYHRALCDLDQAEIYLELNLRDEGERLARLAFDAFEELRMDYEAAKALAFLAVAASQGGKAFAAIDLFERARERFTKEGNAVWQSMLDLYEAIIYCDEGRTFEAGRLARRALQFFLDTRLVDKAILSELLLARVELATGRPGAARDHCRSSLERLEKLDQPALEYKASYVLGEIEEASGDLAAAAAAYRRAYEKLENLRSHLRGEELKIAFFKDKLEVYESLTWMTLRGDPDHQAREAAFLQIEQAKSRALADLLAFRHRAPESQGHAQSQLVKRMSDLRVELNWYYRQIDLQELLGGAAQGDGDSSPDAARGRLAALRQRSLEYEKKLLRTLDELRASDARLGSLQSGSPVSLDEIRASLPEGTVVLEYYLMRGQIHACVLGKDTLEVVPVAAAVAVRDLQRRLHFQLAKFELGEEYCSQFAPALYAGVRRHLSDLYHELIEPVASLLEAERLVIVPHGSLHYLPFHALLDGEEYLIDRHLISFAPSASVFAMCRNQPAAAATGSLVLGVPDERTPQIHAEVEAVAASLPDARLLVGEEATRERLRALAPESRFVHIATHGLFRQDNPMFSAIQLGDGRLTLVDLYQLELDADLVVLSGCGTGLNVVENGDELIGLTRGLLSAGARSAMVTLWDVHDRSTAELMSRFYLRLGNGDPRAEALRQAMIEHRETYPHPYFWAPFAFVGSP